MKTSEYMNMHESQADRASASADSSPIWSSTPKTQLGATAVGARQHHRREERLIEGATKSEPHHAKPT